MRRSGYYSGPGPTGTFTDATAAARAYLRLHGDRVVFVDLYSFVLGTLGTVDTATGNVSDPASGLPGGLVLRMAAADYDVSFEGVVYAGGGAARGWRIARQSIKSELGTTVGGLDMQIMLDGTDLLPPADGNGATPRFGLGEAIHSGLFDLAHVRLRRLILPDHPTYPIGSASMAPAVANTFGAANVVTHLDALGPGDTSLGAVTMFAGQCTEAEVARSMATLKAKSYLEKLSISLPRNHYQTTCLNTLYDAMCAVSRAGSFGGQNFQFLGTIQLQIAADRFTINATQPDDYFTSGTVQFTSGAMCGFALPVESWVQSSGILTLGTRAPRVPRAGDGVCVQAGCNKIGLYRDPSDGKVDAIGTMATPAHCGAKFDNLVNFRAFSHIPPPETAY